MKTLLIYSLFLLLILQNVYSQENIESPAISEFEETGNYLKALSQAKSRLETDSLNENLWAEIARLYRLNQQYKQAIAAYNKALKINPANHKHILALAKTNRLAGNKDLSIGLYKEFLNFEANNIMALSDLAFIYSSNNQSDSAANTYRKLHLIDTSNVEYLQKWASSQWFSGNYEEGFSNYKKACRLDSTYLPVVFDLARIYINNKMQDSAISILEMNIKLSPQESRLYADLGTAIFSKGDYYFAIPEYEKAIQFGYKGAEVYKRLAICYYSTGKFDKSKPLFETLIAKDTADYKICMYLGNIYNNEGNTKKAIVFFMRAIDLLTPDPMVITAIYSGLADTYHAEGKYVEAIKTIQIRQDNTPVAYKSPQYLFEIAVIYEKDIKDKAKALDYYEKYYTAMTESNLYSPEKKEAILFKIKKLKNEMPDTK